MTKQITYVASSSGKTQLGNASYEKFIKTNQAQLGPTPSSDKGHSFWHHTGSSLGKEMVIHSTHRFPWVSSALTVVNAFFETRTSFKERKQENLNQEAKRDEATTCAAIAATCQTGFKVASWTALNTMKLTGPQNVALSVAAAPLFEVGGIVTGNVVNEGCRAGHTFFRGVTERLSNRMGNSAPGNTSSIPTLRKF